MAAPPPVFSDLFNDATKWDEPVPDYDALILLLGGVVSTAAGGPALYDRAQTMAGLANLARRSCLPLWYCSANDQPGACGVRPSYTLICIDLGNILQQLPTMGAFELALLSKVTIPVVKQAAMT